MILTRPSFAKCPVDTEALRSGSKSTSCQDTDEVAKAEVAALEPMSNVPVSESLIEYPNLPAPYRPPEASTFEPEVLPKTSECCVCASVCAVPYLKSR